MATTLISGDETITVRANAAARLFFHEEFGRGIDDDINTLMSKSPLMRQLGKLGLKFSECVEMAKGLSNGSPSETLEKLTEQGVDLDTLLLLGSESKFEQPELPSYELMPVLWAMHKAQAEKEGISANFPPTYRDWLLKYADFDINDCADEFEAEIRKGFFRQGNGKAGNRKRK